MPKAREMLSQTRISTTPPGDASNGTAHSSPNGLPPAGGPPKKNDKDRPKRKKAHRACASCQRAHLTCSNERPCERCVRRQMGHSCTDGVRKKAKYLNDEENGRLATQLPPGSIHHPQSPPSYEVDPPVPQALTSSNTSPALQISPPDSATLFGDQNGSPWLFDIHSFPTEVNTFRSNYANTEDKAMHRITTAMGQPHVGSAIGTPDNLTPQGSLSYSPSQAYMQYPSNSGNDMLIDAWPPQSRSNSAGGNMSGIPHTFTIAAGPGSIATPSPPAASPQGGQPQASRIYDTLSGSPRTANGPFYRQAHGQGNQQLDQKSRQNTIQQHYPKQHNSTHLQPQGHSHAPQPVARRRAPAIDPSHVYTSVTEPYSYVQAYHRLFATIDPRFTKEMQMRIARAFSAFRPSFIASAQALRSADLIFQEKSCQRAIHIYESSLPIVGTPTVVCRRSGEVVVVGKEFSMLSGWPKEVLLGEKPNLNTNVPHAGRDEAMAQKRKFLSNQLANGGENSDVAPDGDDTLPNTSTRPQPPGTPVFLMDLLDDESVCEFYDDFAKVAFADATGKITKKCKILKYKPPQPTPPARVDEMDDTDTAEGDDKQRPNGKSNKRGSRPSKDSTIDVLGSSTTINCMMCWQLRRDVFDIPMLIILNFLPNLLAPPSSGAGPSNSRESEHNSKRNGAGGSSGSSGGNMKSNSGNSSSMMKQHGGDSVRVR